MNDLVSVRLHGTAYQVPKAIAQHVDEVSDEIVAARKDAARQMVIQIKTSNILRNMLGIPNPAERNWIAFALFFPIYVAIGGMPSVAQLCQILSNFFSLSHIAFREHTFGLAGAHYGFKTFHVSRGVANNNDPFQYTLTIGEDAKQTLHHICEALRHIGYEFEVEFPQSELHNECVPIARGRCHTKPFGATKIMMTHDGCVRFTTAHIPTVQYSL